MPPPPLPSAGQALFPLPQAKLARFLQSMQALQDPAVRAELLQAGPALSPACGPVLAMVDDPGFRAQVEGLREAGSEACARDLRLALAAYLQDRFPEAVATLRGHDRAPAQPPGLVREQSHQMWTIVQEFTVVVVFPHGFPDTPAGPPPPPGPSPWITPRALSLITTHRCTAACEHCCFSCSPALDRAIPVPRLHSLIDEAVGIPSIELIVFTGGECFLLGRQLDDLLARCRGHRLRTRCVTNGYWATSPAAASARARDLAAAGLQEINFSTGTFHARYVPVERIRWGVQACAAQGIRPLINLELFEGSDFPEESLTGDPGLRALVEEGRLILNRACWVPNGGEIWGCASQGRSSATGLDHPDRTLRFRDERNKTACPSSLEVLAVNPDQELITCCGLTLEHTPSLHVGSLKDRALGEAIAAIQPDLLKLWIHLEGPERILDFLKERDPGLELPLDSAHICHTCQYLHASTRAMAALRAHAGEVQDRILEQYFLEAAAKDWAARTAGPLGAEPWSGTLTREGSGPSRSCPPPPLGPGAQSTPVPVPAGSWP